MLDIIHAETKTGKTFDGHYSRSTVRYNDPHNHELIQLLVESIDDASIPTDNSKGIGSLSLDQAISHGEKVQKARSWKDAAMLTNALPLDRSERR